MLTENKCMRDMIRLPRKLSFILILSICLYVPCSVFAASSSQDESEVAGAVMAADPKTAQITLTEEERAWLEEHSDIVLGYTDSFEPEVIVNPDGSLRGIQVDILNELNKRLGTQIRLQIYPVAELIENVQKREVGGILSIHPEYADELGLLKTGIYFTGYPAVFARKDVAFRSHSDFVGKRVAVIDKVFFSRKIIEQYGQEATVLKVQDAKEGLRFVDNGQVDYFLGATLNAYLIAKYQLFDLATQHVFYDYPIDVVIGTRSDWPELSSILDKGLSSFSKEEIQAIKSKWSGINHENGISPVVLKWILIIVGIAIGIVLLFVIWNRQLSRKVRERTAEIVDSEQRFRATFEQAAVGIAHVSLEGCFLRINQKFCEIVGYTPDEMLDLTFQEITYPVDLDEDVTHINELLAGEIDTYSMEKRYIHKNGELVWIHLTVSLIRNKIGQPQWFVSVIKDITERKQTEVALKVSEEKFRNLVEQSPISIQIHTLDGRLMQSNSAFTKLYAFEKETLTELYEKYNVLEDDQATNKGLMPYIEKVFSGQEVSFPEYEYDGVDTLKTLEFKKPISRRCWMQTLGFPLKDKDGNVTSVVFMSKDITERKEAEEGLKINEEKFRNLMEQSPISIQISNPDGSLNEVNPAFLNLWGYSDEDLPELFERYNVLQDEQAGQLGVMPLLERAYKGEEVTLPPIQYDPTETMKSLDFIKPKGRKRWVLVRLYPIKDEKGQLLNIVHIEEDITETKVAEEEMNQLRAELLHSSRAGTMVELTAALAHELNHPLGSILNNASAAKRYLEKETPNLDEIREIIEDILSEDRRANDVMQRLRNLMKKSEIEFFPIQINTVIEEVLKLTQSELVIENISLSKQLSEDLPKINGDRIQLQQVFLNLIINAKDAMKDSITKKLCISTSQQEEGHILVCVGDSGEGIPQEKKESLFKPFFSTKKEGMGMGLSVSKTIINSHGGEIWAENNKEGGANFFITIPVYKEKMTS